MSKSNHGGNHGGAGRKKALPNYFLRIAGGGECERLWREYAEQKMMNKYESRPYIVDVREEQARLASIPVRSRENANKRAPGSDLTVGETLKEVSEEIEELMKS